jgi:hypothetical protein
MEDKVRCCIAQAVAYFFSSRERSAIFLCLHEGMKVAIFWGMSSRLSSLELNPSGEVVGARFAVESVIFAAGEIRVVEQVIHPKSHGQFRRTSLLT